MDGFEWTTHWGVEVAGAVLWANATDVKTIELTHRLNTMDNATRDLRKVLGREKRMMILRFGYFGHLNV